MHEKRDQVIADADPSRKLHEEVIAQGNCDGKDDQA